MAEWDTAYINNLPDSAFAVIEPGGTKDDQGKTVPRSLRKLPHHDSAGAVDKAHLANAMAREPQSDLTPAEHQKAHAHLMAHEKAMGMGEGANALPAAPEKRRPELPSIEVRNTSELWPDEDMQIRALDEGDGMTFEGYAAVFNRDSEPMATPFGSFVERIKPGAFKRSLKTDRNIRMFLNHNTDILLGSTPAKTLSLSEDDRGLKALARLPDTQAGRDLSTLIKRGDVTSMSFGFAVTAKGEKWNDDFSQRELTELKLYEVSPVTGWPAYSDTQAMVRSLAKIANEDMGDLDDAFRTLSTATEALSTEQYNLLLGVLNKRRGERGIVVPPSVAEWRRQIAPLVLPTDRSLDDLAAFLLADVSALQAAINKLANGEPLLQQEAELLEAAIEHLEPPDADEDDNSMMGMGD